jgi:CheY-like chemotaxis protein
MKTENDFDWSAPGGRARWMIVDDDQDILSLIRDIVARFSDVDIECFNSPKDALTAFQAEPEAFEFVITDLEMPGMSGVELCRRLRGLSPSLKILLSTGSEMMSDEEAAQKGFCGLLRKPFPFAALQHALEPATLKYSQKFSGLNDGLRLVRAN